MKKTCVLFLLSIACLSAVAQTAQPAKPLTGDAAFSESLSKIVLDFTYNFINIQGAKMPVDVDADSYRSKVCIPGAIGCKVMRYHSVEDKSASWQSALYAGDSFDEALKAYKKIFGQVKKTSVKGIDATPCGFDGKMDAVDENVGFAVSSLRLKTKDRRYQNLVAEVEITSGYTGWEVRLNVYTKKLIAESDEMQ
jgi:hypothetical protein